MGRREGMEKGVGDGVLAVEVMMTCFRLYFFPGGARQQQAVLVIDTTVT